ncbi:hypothetical protein LDC_1715 [sediment metagenome]|uniref:Uncharacterized protein n=1 Tax=sediment metagenome TaxID=749907 RepID=D9PJK4_9ZZZZ
MKLLGHVYVAVKAFPQKNHELLAFGAILPETVFYTKNPVLTFEQIHEGGPGLFWRILAQDVKEKDPVDIDKTAQLLEVFYNKLKPKAEDFLSTVVSSTRERILKVINLN